MPNLREIQIGLTPFILYSKSNYWYHAGLLADNWGGGSAMPCQSG